LHDSGQDKRGVFLEIKVAGILPEDGLIEPPSDVIGDVIAYNSEVHSTERLGQNSDECNTNHKNSEHRDLMFHDVFSSS